MSQFLPSLVFVAGAISQLVKCSAQNKENLIPCISFSKGTYTGDTERVKQTALRHGHESLIISCILQSQAGVSRLLVVGDILCFSGPPKRYQLRNYSFPLVASLPGCCEAIVLDPPVHYEAPHWRNAFHRIGIGVPPKTRIEQTDDEYQHFLFPFYELHIFPPVTMPHLIFLPWRLSSVLPRDLHQSSYIRHFCYKNLPLSFQCFPGCRPWLDRSKWLFSPPRRCLCYL